MIAASLSPLPSLPFLYTSPPPIPPPIRLRHRDTVAWPSPSHACPDTEYVYRQVVDTYLSLAGPSVAMVSE